jgi:DNA-binding helix-hairpin-helix protein with protein kinase domain
VNVNADLITTSGLVLRLGKLLGQGGEAKIFQVASARPLAVKLYVAGKAAERRDKVNAMISDRLFERTSSVAFPIEAVTSKGAFVGFTMRQAIGAKPLHQLCTPGDRKAEFPTANFRFLVHVALNFARVVANIYELDALIGDINESVALVDQKGLVTVVDSDSFQYCRTGQLYRCLVGKPEYTPPELQGQSLGKIDRTVNHDAFGLAVIIFEILFMGRHPFAGTYKGVGDQLSISKAIQEGRFAYSPQRSLTQMEPPPHVPVLADIPPEIAEAFQRAFGSQAAKPPIRPTATEWLLLLERMEKGIIECGANPAHYFSRTARSCPWCRFESGTGIILFVAQHTVSRSSFDLISVLAKIERIESPGSAPDLISLMPTTGHLKLSPAARDFQARLWTRKAAGLAAAGLALFLMLNRMGWGFLLLIPAGILFFREVSGLAAIRQQCAKAQSDWKRWLEHWNLTTGASRFDEKKGDLLRAASSYRTLPSVEKEMLQKLELRKRELQMKKHLENHKLSKASIENIGDGRKMTLRSFGVETAWDIEFNKIMAVPGFGPAFTKKLTDWRNAVEAKFKFNPNIPTDRGEIAKVRAEIATRRSAMETTLLQGAKELEAIRAEALTKRNDFKEYQTAYLAMRQAERDAALF